MGYLRVAVLCTVGFVLALCCACDPGSVSTPAAATCKAIGVHCQLPDGPLGVCQEAPCELGGQPPCFKCTSQH